jgi:hypothetical protein
MIIKHSNESQTRWDRGELKVQLVVAGSDRPWGFCDGSDADLAELREIAESEGAEGFAIERKRLKTGREVWTLG